MLYRCQSCVIDLSRVVAINEIGSSRTFHLTMTGASQIFYEAADRTRVALEALEDDRRRLLSAWEQYRHSLPRGKGSICYLQGQYINILAVSAITDVRRMPDGMGHYGGQATFKHQFDVHLMGFKEPIVSKCMEGDTSAVAALRKNHDELVDAWLKIHEQRAA